MSDSPVTGPGRVAVVTGGASGIGKGLCLALAGRGSSVVVADLDGSGAEAVAGDIRRGGGRAEAVQVDVSDADAVTALAASTLSTFGRVDVVCNNAGVSTFNLISDQTLDDWRWVVAVDFWGVVHGIHAFLPILKAQGTPAHIVNTASIGGLLSGVPFIGPYCAMKAAVISVSETLSQELAMEQSPVKVSVLCPSAVDTNVMESERVRSASLGTERRTETAEAVRLAIKGGFTGPDGLTPDRVAEEVMDAIDTGRFWILTHPGEKGLVEARNAGMLASFPAPRS
jgi:NAD(P)-dependent dehydrogenase (short-subunit alcohol dehydrogenase family)